MSETTNTEAIDAESRTSVENSNGTDYFKEYAHVAGLEERDMPSAHHPLMENDAEVRKLSDLIDVRAERSQSLIDANDLDADDPNLDIQEALTFPHKRHQSTSAERIDSLSGFNADARGKADPDDEDDSSYMGRADLEASMLETDPDPNTGMDGDDFIGDANLDRAPDMTGTVMGVARGTSTHLPQDLGADGFQIEEPETLETSLLDDEDEMDSDAGDGGRIAVSQTDVDSRDEALDATRRLK